MKFIFAIYKYFPYGGLQKDMLAIAEVCAQAGHEVNIFCRSWSGTSPQTHGIKTNVLPCDSRFLSNHGKDKSFAKQLRQAITRIKPDLVVGFNKIPGIDIYYAGDTSFKAKLYRERPYIYRCLPRYRAYVKDEEALFKSGTHTHVLAISQAAIDEYQAFYKTESKRFTLLPPGISRDRINTQGEHTFVLHQELELTQDKLLVLMVGSGFRTKGLDRAIDAIAALPPETRDQTHLVVVGEDKREAFLRQAEQQNIIEQVHFLGGRKDIPQLMRSADLLIHPAYRENTGTVLLEAAVSCLPVLVTDVCGYSHYIAENNLGIVLRSPFQAMELTAALIDALTNDEKIKQWRQNGLRFASKADIYNLPQKAADTIERIAQKKGAP